MGVRGFPSQKPRELGTLVFVSVWLFHFPGLQSHHLEITTTHRAVMSFPVIWLAFTAWKSSKDHSVKVGCLEKVQDINTRCQLQSLSKGSQDVPLYLKDLADYIWNNSICWERKWTSNYEILQRQSKTKAPCQGHFSLVHYEGLSFQLLAIQENSMDAWCLRRFFLRKICTAAGRPSSMHLSISILNFPPKRSYDLWLVSVWTFICPTSQCRQTGFRGGEALWFEEALELCLWQLTATPTSNLGHFGRKCMNMFVCMHMSKSRIFHWQVALHFG